MSKRTFKTQYNDASLPYQLKQIAPLGKSKLMKKKKQTKKLWEPVCLLGVVLIKGKLSDEKD